MRSEIGGLQSVWARYDDVAESYHRFEASNGYARLAREVVTALNLPPDASLLDVGAVTDVAAELTSGVVEPAHRRPNRPGNADAASGPASVAARTECHRRHQGFRCVRQLLNEH